MGYHIKYIWKDEEIEYLIENFENSYNSDLSIILNKSEFVIMSKAHELNLKKNKLHLTQIGIKSRKNFNRNLTNEDLKKIALKYKTRYEFQKNDSRAYAICCKQKILDSVCMHMFTKKYSTPQLLLFEMLKIIFLNNDIKYNDRSIIKPYEIDIFIKDFNLGFEYNGKYWHKNNYSDDIKIKLCNENNINLIIIKEYSKNYCIDIKNQLIDNLKLINDVSNLQINSDDILYIDNNILYQKIKNNIINVEDIKNIIGKYIYFSDFRKNEYILYIKLANSKQLDYYTSNLIRNKINWNIDSIIKVINKYKNYSDFINENNSCYKYIKAHKLEYLCDNLVKNKNYWNIDSITNIIKQYNNYSDFINENNSCYKYIKKHKLEYLCDNLNKTTKIKWSFDMIKEIIYENNIKSISEFNKKYGGGCKFIYKNNLTNKINMIFQKDNYYE